jgi:hypothetical protein
MNGFAGVFFSVTTVLLCASSGNAQGLVEYEFAGIVTDNSGDLGIFGPFGTVQTNDVFTGRFSYMTGPSNPDQGVGDAQLGGYHVVDFVLDQAFVAIAPMAIVVSHVPGTPTLPPLPPDLGTDGFSVVGSYLLGQEAKSVSLKLEAPYQTVFTDDSLPTTLTFEDFTDLQTVISIRVLGIAPDGTSLIDAGQLTSLVKVPEPSSVGMVLLGVGVLVPSWRRHLRTVTSSHAIERASLDSR